MKTTQITCEGPNCTNSQQVDPYTAPVVHWIEYRRTVTPQSERLAAGLHHYCCEQCLIDALTPQPTP